MTTVNSNTTLQHPETGHSVKLLAGDKVPKWAEDLVGAHLLGDGTRPAPGTTRPRTQSDDELPVTRGWLRGEGGRVLARHMLEAVRELEDDDDQGADDQADQLPPSSGKGSGIEAWQKYADDHGIQYPQGAGRDEILAAVQAHRAQQ